MIPSASKIVADLNSLMAGRVTQNIPLIVLEVDGAKEKILQYYPLHATEIESIKDLYFAKMLDRQMKLNTLKKIGIPSMAQEAAEDYLQEVYHRYKKELDKEGSAQNRQWKNKISNSKKSEETSMSFIYDASQLGDDEDHEGECEVRRYFSQESAKVYESIDEYYRRNEALFPTIFRIAEDYSSMMAFSSPQNPYFRK